MEAGLPVGWPASACHGGNGPVSGGDDRVDLIEGGGFADLAGVVVMSDGGVPGPRHE